VSLEPASIFLSCPDGDPTSPATWSGTPYRLRAELERRGLLAGSLDATALPPRLHRFCRWVATRIFGAESAYAYSPVTRLFRAWRLHRLLAGRPLRVLHTGTLGMPLLWRPRRQRHYLFCDTTWHLASLHSPDLTVLGPVLRRMAEWMDRRSYRQMTHIFAIGRHVRDDLISHYGVSPDRVSAVGTGRGSIAPYRGPKDYRDGQILFVAKLRAEEKGVSLLTQAFALAVARSPGLKLLLVGRDDFQQYAGIPNVTARAFVSPAELQQAFEQSALFAMPARYEPWGLVYLEALACRTPIVAMARNAGPEFCDNGRCGFLLEREDPKALADLLLAAFADTAKLEAMGQHGQAMVLERYGWDLTMDRITHAMERAT
jgi:glycosyltransferase involved in cell wall biosynthesis